LHTTGARLRAWLRASLNQQALGGRLLVLYRCQALLAKWYTRRVPHKWLPGHIPALDSNLASFQR